MLGIGRHLLGSQVYDYWADPGGHRHKRKDEFIHLLEGTPVLFADARETRLSPGMYAGFAASGSPLEDRGKDDEAVILDVEDRGSAEEAISPNDDFKSGHGAEWRLALHSRRRLFPIACGSAKLGYDSQ